MGIDVVVEAALEHLRRRRPNEPAGSMATRQNLGGVNFDMQFATAVLHLGRSAGHSTWAVEALKRGHVLVVPKLDTSRHLRHDLPAHAARIFCLNQWLEAPGDSAVFEPPASLIVFDEGQKLLEKLAMARALAYGPSTFSDRFTYLFLG